MIRENKARRIAIFYTNGTCNLRCRYCNIDKNPALLQIDKLLEKSFEDPTYYLERVKKYFKPWQLEKVETWGGEPFLGMHRALPLFHELIKAYPNLLTFYSSTNFSYPTWLNEFWGLMDVFAAYPNRTFKYTLQLSVDGPTELNDFNRGNGVTERCLKNYQALIDDLKAGRLSKNIQLEITTKGTLDTDSIRNLEKDRNNIIKYYQFLEKNYIMPAMDIFPNIIIDCSIPNVAVPTPATVEVGKIFASFLRKCRQIESENQNGANYFEFYNIITPFSDSKESCPNLSYCSPMGFCGTGDSMIGFLPDNLVSICNEGFTEMVSAYSENLKSRPEGSINFRQYIDDKCILCKTDEEYAIHEDKMSMYKAEYSTAKLVDTVAQIMALALSGQVESKYLNERDALEAAVFIHNHTAFCVKDNYNENGTFSMIPLGTIKLFLNGALEYIKEGELAYGNGITR